MGELLWRHLKYFNRKHYLKGSALSLSVPVLISPSRAHQRHDAARSSVAYVPKDLCMPLEFLPPLTFSRYLQLISFPLLESNPKYLCPARNNARHFSSGTMPSCSKGLIPKPKLRRRLRFEFHVRVDLFLSLIHISEPTRPP